jgi:hypothetical protein
MPVFFLGIERLLDPSKRRPGGSATRYAVSTAGVGLLASWLHPWQGVCLLLVLSALVVWSGFDRRNVALIGPILATAAPVAYYSALAQFDRTWAAESANALPLLPVWVLAISLAPLALPALFAMPGGSLDVQERILRIWPAASVATYLLVPNYPYHAFEGITLPLAILAVRKAATVVPRRAVAVAVASLTLPGIVIVNDFRRQLRLHQNPYYITPSERSALDYLERSKRPGGVLAAFYLGQTVPALTGRNTWVGQQWWTPNSFERSRQAGDLFAGRLPPRLARRLVVATGAGFLLSDCKTQKDLTIPLGNLVTVRRFGCAAVYEVQKPTRAGNRTLRR